MRQSEASFTDAYRQTQALMPRNAYEISLIESSELSTAARSFVFARVDGEPFSFVPGQFFMFHWDDDTLNRSYSVATLPERDKPTEGALAKTSTSQVEFAIAHTPDGRATARLWPLKPGDRLRASGPYGRFVLRGQSPKRYLLIATGTGLGPFRGMIPELERRAATDGAEVVLLLGVRDRGELLYDDDLTAFSTVSGVTVVRCFSREDVSTDSGETASGSHSGYVQSYLSTLNPDPESDMVYLCGNPQMVDACVELLTKCAFPPARVRREKYTSV